jgi:hypothetical protein
MKERCARARKFRADNRGNTVVGVMKIFFVTRVKI